MENIIKTNNLNFKYDIDGPLVINGVNLEIPHGQYVALLGHNGSGKSTLAKLLCGLEAAESGDIYIGGLEMSRKNINEIRKLISIVFQNPDNQFIGSTVEDDIAFGLENHCIEREEMIKRIKHFSAAVNMGDFLQSEPQKLSGGQKQRVAIAGILAFAPNIIVFDEATSMLDPIGKKEVNNLIKKIAVENNITVISVTHDMEEAKNADRVIVMEHGKIMLDGTPTEIFKQKEKMKNFKLDIPFALKVSSALNNKGFEVDEVIHIEELIACL